MRFNNFYGFLLLFFFASNLQAQQKIDTISESVIIVSENDIVSLINTLKTHKKQKVITQTNTTKLAIENIPTDLNTLEVTLLKNKISKLETLLHNNTKSTLNSNSTFYADKNIEKELSTILDEISQLRNLLMETILNIDSNKKTIVIPANFVDKTQLNPVEETSNQFINKNAIVASNKNDKILEKKLDSLNMLVLQLNQLDSTNYNKDFKLLKDKIAELSKNINTKITIPTDFDVLVDAYKDFNKIIYFANNATSLNEKGISIITALSDILKNNNKLDVVVKGFASNKGNALYNENLSMMRTETVKKGFILKNVHPMRVLTQYHGIDYSKSSDEARRVEISILVRK